MILLPGGITVKAIYSLLTNDMVLSHYLLKESIPIRIIYSQKEILIS